MKDEQITETCVKCGTPKRFNDVDKWCPNPNCKYFEDYEIIEHCKPEPVDDEADATW
jgi:hypothetical protein